MEAEERKVERRFMEYTNLVIFSIFRSSSPLLSIDLPPFKRRVQVTIWLIWC
jgi:hypothetical protein